MLLNYDLIRQDKEAYAKKLAKKNYNGLDELLALEEKYRAVLTRLNDARAERNQAAEKRDIEKGKQLKLEVEKLEQDETKLKDELLIAELAVPNAPMDEVPEGGENDAKEIIKVGEPTKFTFPIKDHLELALNLDILDMERAAKAAGARFYYLKNKGLLLEWALLRFVTDKLLDKGFQLMSTPHLLKKEVMQASGFNGEDDIYHLEKDDLYLNGTAEQCVLGYLMDDIIEKDKLPCRIAAYSTAYRREAGSHGKDVKGIIRLHQFDKLEMFCVVAPEDSEAEHQMMIGIAEEVLKDLELPYRKVLLAANDCSRASVKTYDLEVWLPSQNCYRETHSCSNTTDFQTRRAKIRYRTNDDKTAYPHALNATAIALPRFLVPLLENYQTKKGTIKIPKALKPYVGFAEIANTD